MQAGRSARRSGAGIRWIAVGVVITLFVLLIDASLNSRSTGAIQQISVGAWVDRVLPVITSSNADGQELAAVWQNGLTSPPSVDASTVSAVAAQAARDYQAVTKLAPPVDLGGAAGLLDAALLSREKAAAFVQAAFLQSLGSAATSPGTGAGATGTTNTTTSTTSTISTTTSTTPTTAAATSGPPAATIAGLGNASSDLQLGDQAYQLFQQSLPGSVGVKFPDSAWAANLAPYTTTAAQVFFATLASKAVTTPLYQAGILSITTDPPPVSTAGNLVTLPDASAITVDVVVADTGNQAMDNLQVTAAISPAANGASSVRDFVNLGVGQAYTINGFGPLDPPLGVPVTLTVTISGSTLATVTQSITFQMPAPPPSTTTSTSTTTASG